MRVEDEVCPVSYLQTYIQHNKTPLSAVSCGRTSAVVGAHACVNVCLSVCVCLHRGLTFDGVIAGQAPGCPDVGLAPHGPLHI